MVLDITEAFFFSFPKINQYFLQLAVLRISVLSLFTIAEFYFLLFFSSWKDEKIYNLITIMYRFLICISLIINGNPIGLYSCFSSVSHLRTFPTSMVNLALLVVLKLTNNGK